ncbi:MAG: TetR/AcrR family transcriptional regulator [Arcobacteraceae bacterium]
MTKAKILKISTEEFSLLGYDGVSMNNLAKKLEINKATIYYHFKDKQTLYQEVIISLMQKNREKEYELIASTMAPKEKFRALIDLIIQEFKETPEIIAIILREMANVGQNLQNDVMDHELKKDMDILNQIIKQLPLKEKYKNIDISIVHSFIIGTITSYFSFQMSNIGNEILVDLGKDKNRILNYSSQMVSDILLDAICI